MLLGSRAARLQRSSSVCALCKHRLINRLAPPSLRRSLSISRSLYNDNANGSKPSFGAGFGGGFGQAGFGQGGFGQGGGLGQASPSPVNNGSPATASASELLSPEERQARDRLLARRAAKGKEAQEKEAQRAQQQQQQQPKPRPMFKHNWNVGRQNDVARTLKRTEEDTQQFRSTSPPLPRGMPPLRDTTPSGDANGKFSRPIANEGARAVRNQPNPNQEPRSATGPSSAPSSAAPSVFAASKTTFGTGSGGFGLGSGGFGTVFSPKPDTENTNRASVSRPGGNEFLKEARPRPGTTDRPRAPSSLLGDNSFSRRPASRPNDRNNFEGIRTTRESQPNRYQARSLEASTREGAWGLLSRKSKDSSPSKETTEEISKEAARSQGFWESMEQQVAQSNSKPSQYEDWGANIQLSSKTKSDQKSRKTKEDEPPEPVEIPEMAPVPEPSSAQAFKRGKTREGRLDIEDDSLMNTDEKKTKSRSKKSNSKPSRFEDEYGDEGGHDDGYLTKKEKKAARKAQREAEREGPKPIFLPELIAISALSDALKVEPNTFLEQLGELGFEGVTLDSLMAGETAALVAQEYGFEPTVDLGGQRDLRPRPPPEDPSSLPQRPPVVTIMGHVDHGKTTLLDYLRQSSIAAQEHGGITQHIGAFPVKLSSGKQITFLDTPGHAAFLNMRQRGANVTDIVILVVAADDSVKPQTIEAMKHAREAKVPIIVAINKIDKDGANIDRVKSDLSTNGVEIEDFGGDVQVVCVSGKTGQGMEDLEENILTLSEILDMRAETDGAGEGWILESNFKSVGKAATVLVTRGTLRPGDYIAAGLTWAKIRALRDEAGAELDEAPPGTPVEITGWRDLPAAGDRVIQAPDEGRAKDAVEYREGLKDRESDARAQEAAAEARKAHQEKRNREKAALAEINPQVAHLYKSGAWNSHKARLLAQAREQAKVAFDEVEAGEEEESGPTKVNFIVKADVHGSTEAVCASILEIGNHEVAPRILRSGTGPFTEFDVEHASLASATLVSFGTDTPSYILRQAEEQGVEYIDNNVIYRLADQIKDKLSTFLAPEISIRSLGEAEIQQVFPINLKGRVYKNIAGCRVRNGVVAKNSMYRVTRGGQIVFDGKLETLKNVKKDVTEMRKGTECGMGFIDFQDFEVGDQIMAYEEVSTPRSL